jgi:hypothetical protein
MRRAGTKSARLPIDNSNLKQPFCKLHHRGGARLPAMTSRRPAKGAATRAGWCRRNAPRHNTKPPKNAAPETCYGESTARTVRGENVRPHHKQRSPRTDYWVGSSDALTDPLGGFLMVATGGSHDLVNCSTIAEVWAIGTICDKQGD